MKSILLITKWKVLVSNIPEGVEGPALYPLRQEIAQHEPYKASHGLGWDRICLDSARVVPPGLPNLHQPRRLENGSTSQLQELVESSHTKHCLTQIQ